MLLLGLGNPGNEYDKTRHNAGFLALDRLAEKLQEKWSENREMNAMVIETNIDGKKIILAKPQTFMNRSGEAAQKLAAHFRLIPEQIIVIYDDVDLSFGTIRVRKGGSAGGHNGIKSLITSLQNDTFARMRIGIGEKPEQIPLEDYVLSRFTETEWKALEKINTEASKILLDGIAKAMLEERTYQVL